MKLLPGPRRSPRRFWIFAALAGVAVIVVALTGEGDEQEVVTVAHPRRPSAPRASAGERVVLGFAHRAVSNATGNLFVSHSWYVAPPPPPPQVLAPPVPTAPPLPYSYLGRYGHTGDKTVFFIVKDDRVYDVHVGDVLEKTYSIDGVENGQLQMTYLPLGIRQSLQVGGAP